MAGRGRRAAGRPMVRTLRHERRAANLTAELAVATTIGDRVSVAAGYFRGALALNPDAAEAERLVVELITAANRIYKKAGARR